jgi:outer membrane lipoprotein LolB
LNSRSFTAALLTLIAIFSIAGCTLSTSAQRAIYATTASWSGRLLVRVQSDPRLENSQAQSVNSAFELHGGPDHGDLILLTPFGSTAATVTWRPGAATLNIRGQVRQFDNISELIENLLGTPVPVNALFKWLDGHDLAEQGWQVDLTEFQTGKIAANRTSPLPQAEIRVMLEQ